MANIPGWVGELTGSASGSLGSPEDVDITMNERSFFPNIRSSQADTFIETVSPTGAASGQTGKMWLNAVTAANYVVNWRYIQV